MKNKKLVVVIAISVVVIIGLIYYFLSAKKPVDNLAKTTESKSQEEESVIPSITAEDIGLSLTSTFNNKKVLIGISKTEDLSSIDYQLSYTSKGNVPRGVLGQIQVKAGRPISQEIILGTCSDVCHYDEGVASVELTLKIVKTDGNVYQLTKILKF